MNVMNIVIVSTCRPLQANYTAGVKLTTGTSEEGCGLFTTMAWRRAYMKAGHLGVCA